MSTTGIPVEVLFTVIAALISGIYLDLKREVRMLRSESRDRGVALAVIKNSFNNLCKHLKAPFHIEEF